MHYNVSFDIVAVILFVVILIAFGSIRKYSYPIYRAYTIMVLTSLVTAAFDILSCITIEQTALLPMPVNYTINILYYLSQNLVITFFARYVTIIANLDAKVLFRKLLIYAPYGVNATIIVLSPLLHTVLYFDENLVYSKGFLAFVPYAITVYYIVLCVIIIVKYHSSIEMKKVGVLLALCVMNVGFVVLQFFFKEQLLMSFSTAICMYVLIFAVESPAVFFDKTNSIKMDSFLNIIKSSYKSGTDFCVIVVDIRNIKVLFNLLSHDKMDEILCSVTDFLYSLEKDTVVCRKGGQTFLIKVNNTDIAQNLIDRIQKRFKLQWKSSSIDTTLTVGLACIKCPKDADNAEEFLDVIDIVTGMIEPGQIAYASEIGDRSRRREVLRAVKEATVERKFKVFYQPIYSVKKERITAAEALIRLFDDSLGFVSPDEFIPIAEKEGYILQIGEFVFEEVCRFFSENQLDNKGIEYIEVNLSIIQCMQYHLTDQYLKIMEKYNILPQQLNLEITETAAIISYDAVKSNITAFCDGGLLLSLDDYGTGYSNISYIYTMPFDYIKVDKCILWSATDNKKAYIVLKNTFKMAKRLNLKIIMEGVETKEQVDLLIALDCDYFQGYYFSKAICGEDFIKFVDRYNKIK